MNKDGGKNTGVVRVLIALLLLMSATMGVWAFCNSKRTRIDDSVYVFDGWIYGREDQKKASAALAVAGLCDYTWRDGKLSVPADKRGQFQAALANAGAYPKAPSEQRLEAVREMSVFESDAKTRIRELNACAIQLERTIEQMRGVEYATVGVRGRKEQVGLTAKNIITASVGVAFLEGYELDADALSAITVASKHLLGVDDVANISIIDLKEGKSFFGVESAVGVSSDVALIAEKERIENYWRKKYLEAFSDISNLRVSVVADVSYIDSEKNEREKASDVESHISSTSYIETPPKMNEAIPSRLATAPAQGRFETLGNLADNIVPPSGETASPTDSSTKENDRSKKGDSCGFAQIGNPRNERVQTVRRRREPILATVETRNRNERRFDDVELKTSSNFKWIDSGARFTLTSFILTDEEQQRAHIATLTPFFERSLKDGVVNANFCSGVRPYRSEEGSERYCYTPLATTRQVGSVKSELNHGSDFVDEFHNDWTELCSITVHIAVPRSYLRGVAARSANSSLSKETFDIDSEERVLGEIKRFAVDLFKPTGKQLGWSDDDFERRFIVVAFSDSELIGGDNAIGAFESPVAEQKSSLEHASLYVQDHENWAPMDLWSHDNESQSAESPVSRENMRENRVAVSEPNGKIAEVSQTVASGVETTSKKIEDEAEKIEDSFVSIWSSVRMKMLKFQNPLVRDVAFLVVVVFLFAGLLLTLKRNRKKRAVKQGDFMKQKTYPTSREGINETVFRGAPRIAHDNNRSFNEFDHLDEYNDELEGELQKIVATHGSLASLQNSEAENSAPYRATNAPSDEYWIKRREALDLIAQYPERTAAFLQKWVKGS